MTKRKAHPLDDLTFTSKKLDDEPVELTSEQQVESRASNVTLPVPVWEWIDAKYAEARSQGGKTFRKSAIIRAVFDVAMSVDVDLSGAQSEDELAQRLLSTIVQNNK